MRLNGPSSSEATGDSGAESRPAAANRGGATVGLVAGGVVIGAVLVLIWSAAVTSTARISAATEVRGFFSAGTVTLDRPRSSANLILDASLLYPGRVARGCVVVDYKGTLPASVRLHGKLTGGDGLERFIELRMTRLDQAACPRFEALIDALPTDEQLGGDAAELIFAGRLDELLTGSGNYDDGLVVEPAATADQRFVLVAEAWVAAGDEAQGLETEFAFIVEARP